MPQLTTNVSGIILSSLTFSEETIVHEGVGLPNVDTIDLRVLEGDQITKTRYRYLLCEKEMSVPMSGYEVSTLPCDVA